MVVKHQIEGYPAFCEFIENLKDPKGNVHVLFSGSKLETGQSWCPTCVEGKYLFWQTNNDISLKNSLNYVIIAKPVVEEALVQAEPDSHFVYVEVGDRAL